MTWPNDVITRRVNGTYYTSTGIAAKGRVTFTPSVRVVDVNDATIVEDAIAVTLDANGSFSIDLPTTDNQLLYPAGWAYEISIRLYGVKPERFFAFLPYGTGAPIDLARLNTTTGSPQESASSSTSRGSIGPRGPGTLVGNGVPPNTTGFDGDIYIDLNNGYYYGPKANSAWPVEPAYIPIAEAVQRYTFTQSMPAEVWNITHTLGGRPSVTVVDSADTVMIGEVSYNNNSSITVTFTSAFSGYAYLT